MDEVCLLPAGEKGAHKRALSTGVFCWASCFVVAKPKEPARGRLALSLVRPRTA